MNRMVKERCAASPSGSATSKTRDAEYGCTASGRSPVSRREGDQPSLKFEDPPNQPRFPAAFRPLLDGPPQCRVPSYTDVLIVMRWPMCKYMNMVLLWHLYQQQYLPQSST